MDGVGLAEEDPVVVRVGEVAYPLSVVQFAVDPYFDLADVFDEELTEEDMQEIVGQTIEHMIGLGVIENKLMETGHNDFTEDEMDLLRGESARQYEQTWQQIWQNYTSAGESVTEAEITSWMNEKGYTQDASASRC